MKLLIAMAISTQRYEEFCIKKKSTSQDSQEAKYEVSQTQEISLASAASSGISLESSMNALCKIVNEFICNQTQFNEQIMRKYNHMEKLQITIAIAVFKLNKGNTTQYW